jgi:hypothetical protein
MNFDSVQIKLGMNFDKDTRGYKIFTGHQNWNDKNLLAQKKYIFHPELLDNPL